MRIESGAHKNATIFYLRNLAMRLPSRRPLLIALEGSEGWRHDGTEGEVWCTDTPTPAQLNIGQPAEEFSSSLAILLT